MKRTWSAIEEEIHATQRRLATLDEQRAQASARLAALVASGHEVLAAKLRSEFGEAIANAWLAAPPAPVAAEAPRRGVFAFIRNGGDDESASDTPHSVADGAEAEVTRCTYLSGRSGAGRVRCASPGIRGARTWCCQQHLCTVCGINKARNGETACARCNYDGRK
jgi:hypothetical protein